MRKQLFSSLIMLIAAGLALSVSRDAAAAPGDKLREIFPADAGFGVSVAFDGQFLYYTNANGSTLHRIAPDGNPLTHQDFAIIGPAGVNAFSYDATRNSFWAADSSGVGIWQIPQPGPLDVSVTGTLQFTITPADLPGNCDNGFGCSAFIDGLAYDGVNDSIWYSPDASERIYHFSAASFLTATPAVPAFIDVNDPPNDMSPECGFDYSSGVAAGANDLWLAADGCPFYFQYSKTGTKLASFPYDGQRAEDVECDNVTFAPRNVIWVRDAFSGRLAAFEQPIECRFGGGVVPTAARMTGGARLLASNPAGGEPQISITIHCDATDKPNRMQVNWKDAAGKEHRFHMTSMTSASCSDDPTIVPNPPNANFDTHDGTGTGRFDGVTGATAEWRIQDAGEPGNGEDRGRITIRDANNNVVLTASGMTLDGNWQAHKGKGQGPAD